MYLSLAFILASFPILTAAVPPTSRGIAVPITRRGSHSNDVAGPSKWQHRIRRSVAYALLSFADRSGDPPITNRKIQSGFATYKRNTGVAHPLSRGIKHVGRDGGGEPLTEDSNAELWYGYYGTISVGTPAVSFTGMAFLYDRGSQYLTLSTIQWTSILEVAIFSCPRRNVDQAAQGTKCMT